MVLATQQLDLGSGLLFAVPIPAEFEAEGEWIEQAIRQALREADEQGVAG
jgi:pseudouridine-5'-phosphate glycosidase